jgi:hypothetical protein
LDVLPPKALYFVQPRSEKFWNCEQEHFILFGRAAKIFGIYQEKQLKLTVFCSACSEIFWNLSTKATPIEFSAAQRKILQLTNRGSSN